MQFHRLPLRVRRPLAGCGWFFSLGWDMLAARRTVMMGLCELQVVFEIHPLPLAFGGDEVNPGLHGVDRGIVVDFLKGEAAALHRRIIMRQKLFGNNQIECLRCLVPLFSWVACLRPLVSSGCVQRQLSIARQSNSLRYNSSILNFKTAFSCSVNVSAHCIWYFSCSGARASGISSALLSIGSKLEGGSMALLESRSSLWMLDLLLADSSSVWWLCSAIVEECSWMRVLSQCFIQIKGAIWSSILINNQTLYFPPPQRGSSLCDISIQQSRGSVFQNSLESGRELRQLRQSLILRLSRSTMDRRDISSRDRWQLTIRMNTIRQRAPTRHISDTAESINKYPMIRWRGC